MKKAQCHTEILILPDGRILVHNLTQTMAALLRGLNPSDRQITQRIGCSRITHHTSRSHELSD